MNGPGSHTVSVRRAWVVAACVTFAACAGKEPELPAPRSGSLIESEGPCGVLPPPPPPWPILVKSPTDLGQCLPATHPDEAITVQVKVAPDGSARPELGFYDQCSGTTFDVPMEVQRCLQARLREWRWVVIETCPARPLDQDYVLAAVRPNPQKARRQETASDLPRWTSRGCAG
jgi:hypothetical protein